MKALAIMAVACTMFAGAATADQMDNGHGGHDGWGSNGGIVVDMPPSMFNGANNSGMPPPDPNEMRCRDARHICFDQWGVDEPGYGRCMTERGC